MKDSEKFGQLIECNMRNTFLEKSYTKCDGETSARPFSENLKLVSAIFYQILIFHQMIALQKL